MDYTINDLLQAVTVNAGLAMPISNIWLLTETEECEDYLEHWSITTLASEARDIRRGRQCTMSSSLKIR